MAVHRVRRKTLAELLAFEALDSFDGDRIDRHSAEVGIESTAHNIADADLPRRPIVRGRDFEPALSDLGEGRFGRRRFAMKGKTVRKSSTKDGFVRLRIGARVGWGLHAVTGVVESEVYPPFVAHETDAHRCLRSIGG